MIDNEKIEQMATVISNFCDKHQYDLTEQEIDDIALDMADKGYGNVSEYKAEREMLGSQIKVLNTIVERLDELLWKGIDKYIMGIDGVEGLKDMWERSAVRAFAEKLRKRLTENRVSNDNVVINANYEIDELLKEYE